MSTRSEKTILPVSPSERGKKDQQISEIVIDHFRLAASLRWFLMV